MDAFRPAPAGRGSVWPRFDARDLVVKVKYGDTLKRFNAFVDGSHFDHDLPALQLKIASAFKFSPDVEFILTYTDEDGDFVMLDDDNDLRDATINQKLNPLRINVQLKRSNVDATRTEKQSMNSKSPRSISLEDQLAQVKSAIDEALKFVPEQVPAVLAKLSHDLRSRAVSSAPSLAELLDRFAKLITRSSNMHPSCGSSDGSHKLGNAKIKLESALMTGSYSEPLNGQNSGISEAGLKNVLSEDPTAQIEQAPSRPSVKGSLVFTSSGAMKSDLKRSLDSEIKIKSYACSKGKSVISPVPPVSTTSHGAPAQRSVPMPYTSCGYNGMANVDMPSLFPPPPIVHPPPPVLYPPTPLFTPYNPISGDTGKTTGDLHSAFPPPPNIYSPFKLNAPPSPIGTYYPKLYSTGSSQRDRMASLFSSCALNPEGVNSCGSSDRSLGTNYGSTLQRTQHRWIQCDGCGVTPIVGPRYKSNVKEDYDLCDACFSLMGNETEYTRLNMPASKCNMKILGKISAVKADCRFIKDVTVPDGTPMAPSTPFTKIWRMCNSGSTAWPYGIQLVWVGGDHLKCLSSVRLAISANGGLNPWEETDVTVDFLAPAKPGRYISYWRLALPSGVKFGQQIWVHIQVEQPIQTSGDKQAAAMDLNQFPVAKCARPFTFDVNSAPVETLRGWPRSYTRGPIQPLFGWPKSSCTLARETMKPKESEPTPNDMSSAPAAVEPFQILIAKAPASSAEAASDSMPACVPAPEAIPLPNSMPTPDPVSASAPAPVSIHVSEAAPATVPSPEEIVNHLEEKMMSELEVLGFLQADLNKQVLRQNNYDLEQSVVDLCGFNEWHPLHEEDISDLR
ncbi:protein NBR1 homolog isoform X4 [Panicum virgatum]|uniref:Uncharacterized protein n=1 Tax=Panicum virgatum TaxID=38727 RepID=A0A8T0QJL7_PANVG|nr:protein NBR1 homolog isoform X4 [Panicum virgatum]KAG2572842.1 hypothetical protein PVAP13_7KG205100 [Panicum virgatum]